ncbi:hypothetical protein N7676_15820 [Stenotrophomonas sp. GD03993]|uniref:hypothetical protein n=1 Tax=unclassified Stenotrophomonas TaxID=196198 RepID=UPI00244CC8C1|nr:MULTISPECIES: hypothetical protein [unclassified Stenotrophomonas]MDH0187702.1 hypothetical protein [Stenotrophomonas sp. GD04051]MDH0465274.1 hypothetical protein [Stenotrophomonas sp. GD03993]MDH0877881.1 hypothetical protein [Stenotrophomonas sp. GD03877]
MNNVFFTGHISKISPVGSEPDQKESLWIELVREEPIVGPLGEKMGKRLVKINFFAYAQHARFILQHAKQGSLLSVEASISNYSYRDDRGIEHEGPAFTLQLVGLGSSQTMKRMKARDRVLEGPECGVESQSQVSDSVAVAG